MILRNSITTPDGTTLISRHVHDFIQYVDRTTGKTYMVDGGLEYLRRSGNGDEVDTSIVVDDNDFAEQVVRENLMWGTYGPNGDQPLKYVALKDLETDHLEAILREQVNLRLFYRRAMEHELKLRNDQHEEAPEGSGGDLRADVRGIQPTG